MTDRLTHEDFMMGVAGLAALRSLCARSQVGAVACASDRRIVSVVWNGPPSAVDNRGEDCTAWCPRGMGISHRPAHSDCLALHAEQNALIHAERGELIGGTMYITRVLCAPCGRAVAGAGIVRVVCGPDAGGVFHRPDEVVEMLAMCGVEVVTYGG